MSKNILMTSLLFLLLLTALVGCSKSDEPEAVDNEFSTYDAAAFDISLKDTSGNLVNVSPDGKTMYAYFTGVD